MGAGAGVWRTRVAWSVAVALAAGCSVPRREAPPVDPATLDDDTFLAYLADRPTVTNDEMLRAALILVDGEDTSADFAERHARLVERGLVRAEWNLRREHIADLGTLAYIICQACRIEGGVNRVLLGSWGLGDRRYALRELRYREIIRHGTEYTWLTGGTLVAALGRAEAYMAAHGLLEMPPEERLEASDNVGRGG